MSDVLSETNDFLFGYSLTISHYILNGIMTKHQA